MHVARGHHAPGRGDAHDRLPEVLVARTPRPAAWSGSGRGRGRRRRWRSAGEAGFGMRSWANRRRIDQTAGMRASGVFVVAWPSRQPIHSLPIPRMAFNLKKVLKALLYSSSQPLPIKDIQAAFERFHRQPCRGARGARGGRGPRGGRPRRRSSPRTHPDLYRGRAVPGDGLPDPRGHGRDRGGAPAADDGLALVDGANGYRLATQPRFARWIRILRRGAPAREAEPVLARDARRRRVPPARDPCRDRAVRGVSAGRRPRQAPRARACRRSSAEPTCRAARSSTGPPTTSLNSSGSSRQTSFPPPTCSPPARSTSG